jgi:predicted DNA-binding transcriptional regulator AlpA
MDDTQQILIDYKAVCKMLGIGQTLFFSLRSSGKIPIQPIRLGKAVRYNRYQIADWIAAGCPVKYEPRMKARAVS